MRQLSEDDDLITADALSVRAAPPSSVGCTTDANDDAVINWWLELGCACVALVIWQIGRVYWGMVARRHPLRTIGGMMRAARRSWVREHLNKGMVPVNTMRDFMKAAEFMARTSVLVVFAVSSYAVAVVAPKVTHGVVALRADLGPRKPPEQQAIDGGSLLLMHSGLVSGQGSTSASCSSSSCWRSCCSTRAISWCSRKPSATPITSTCEPVARAAVLEPWYRRV